MKRSRPIFVLFLGIAGVHSVCAETPAKFQPFLASWQHDSKRHLGALALSKSETCKKTAALWEASTLPMATIYRPKPKSPKQRIRWNSR